MGKIKFAFISTTTRITNPIDDPSVRYRCYHIAEALQNKGHLVTIMPWVDGKSTLYCFDVYIFHRPNSNQIKFIRELKKLNKIVIADYDDLIFGGVENALTAPLAVNQPEKKDEVINYFQRNTSALEMFDYVICSTKPLMEHANKIVNAKSLVIQNTFPKSILEFTKKIKTPKRIFDFGYFAGTSSHQKDFETIKVPLTKFLYENPNVKFLLIGDINLELRSKMLPNIFRVDLTRYLRLFDRISTCRYSISPLVNNLFNQCKSNIKLLESSLVGTHLISQKIPDMSKDENFKVDFAVTEDEWYESFYKALTPRAESANRSITEASYNSNVSAKQLLNFIKEL